jgi:hypothetical protein
VEEHGVGLEMFGSVPAVRRGGSGLVYNLLMLDGIESV